jgi:uncharacterized Zn finger protein
MTLFVVAPLVAHRTCPTCGVDRLHMLLVTDDSTYLRCMTCGCVWQEADDRVRIRQPKPSTQLSS